jgi:hypothetical protein
MRTKSWISYGTVAFGLVAVGGIVGMVFAQVDAIPRTTPLPAPLLSSHRTYESGIEPGEIMVDSQGSNHVQVERMDGHPIQVIAAPGGGLMIDLGVMRKTLVANHGWVAIPGVAHTIVKVPMDMKALRVTVPVPSQPMVSNAATFEDQHGHQLFVSASRLPGPF